MQSLLTQKSTMLGGTAEMELFSNETILPGDHVRAYALHLPVYSYMVGLFVIFVGKYSNFFIN